MASFLVEEITKIAMAMVAGAVLSAIYDVLRIFRKIFTHNTVAYSTEDLLYFICNLYLHITCNCYDDANILNIAYAIESTMDYKGQIAKEVK